MDNSVRLSDLPYTGFDLGPIYNNLFWVVLLIWSFLLAKILIKLSGRKVVEVSQQRQARKEQVLVEQLARGPQILEERVIRYKDPGESILGDTPPIANASGSRQWTASGREPDAFAIGGIPMSPPEIEQKVQKIIKEELAETRAGESDDEFDELDFDRIDFDGINPDVYWQPKPITQESYSAPTSPQQQIIQEQKTKQAPEVSPIIKPQTIITSNDNSTSSATEIPPQAPKIQKKYKDTIKLDTSSMYPRMVLTREEVV